MEPRPARHHSSESRSSREEPDEERGHPGARQRVVNTEDRSDAAPSELRPVLSDHAGGGRRRGASSPQNRSLVIKNFITFH